MARARNWERLSDSTRHRYERAGISRSDYLSGMSLKAARGHSRTPEHPGRKVSAGQEQYWINRIVEKAFGDRIKYRGPADITNIPSGRSAPSLADIEFALELSDYELEVLAADPDYWWLFYHGE